MISDTPLVAELKRFKQARGLTVVAFAKRLRLHPNGLRKILSGDSVPRCDTLGRMARLGAKVWGRSMVITFGLPPRARRSRKRLQSVAA